MSHIRVRYAGRAVPPTEDEYFLQELAGLVQAHRRRLVVEAAMSVIQTAS